MRHPWRVAIVVVGLLAVLNLGYFLSRESDTSEPDAGTLPAAIETVRPQPGTTTGLQVDIVADLRAGLTGNLSIDGACVPVDQLDRDSSLGTVGLTPGAEDRFTRFEPGVHQVVVFYRDGRDPEPDNGCDPTVEGVSTHRWEFRATS